MSHKLYILKSELQKSGALGMLKKIAFALRARTERTIKNNSFLANLWCGVAPHVVRTIYSYKKSAEVLTIPRTSLLLAMRQFWYCNTPGAFSLDGEKISRSDMYTYGGPSATFTCLFCQKSEWLSRVRQKNLFLPHFCQQAEACKSLCSKQGDELWTHLHQNFDFCVGCDATLPAPKCLYLLPKYSYKRFLAPRCDQGFLVGKRRLATTCQIDVVEEVPPSADISRYDFLFMFNEGINQKFPRPNIPIILYGHDYWDGRSGYQSVISWVQPDIFLTSYPSQWKENYKFPAHTKIMFYPIFPSLFFTRPNVHKKKLDLLVLGALSSTIYQPRLTLNEKIAQLTSNYRIEFSHRTGALGNSWDGPVSHVDPITGSEVRYLNKWSEYLSSAKYAVFGRAKYPCLFWKYYETLGSGAIPIFPEVPDLTLLGVKPFTHYIPLSEIENRNDQLRFLLDHYNDYRPIAENAVRWYKENENRLLIDMFEETVRSITNFKYPKRVL